MNSLSRHGAVERAISLHHAPGSLGDRFALAACKLMRFGADLFFRKRYMHRAVVLETVAAVPGLVGAMLQHLRSLRVMRGRADMVKTLMDESENERMHLMAFVALCQPSLFERLLALRNDVGLLAEEYDTGAQRLVGNFPQAFSHVALVNTAHNLAHAKKPAAQRSS